MTTFFQRLENDKKFKEIMKELLFIFTNGRVIFKEIGQEVSLAEIHQHIRYKHDITSEFIRYMPDGFVCWDKSIDKPSLLVELKAAVTGLKFDNSRLIKEIRTKVKDLRKEEVINIESGSWENLLRLKKVGVRVMLFVYASFHPEKWLSINPSEELNLRVYERYEMVTTLGSGTPIVNIFGRINNINVFSLPYWLANEFSIDEKEVRKFLESHPIL